jgi:hypothetical protein
MPAVEATETSWEAFIAVPSLRDGLPVRCIGASLARSVLFLLAALQQRKELHYEEGTSFEIRHKGRVLRRWVMRSGVWVREKRAIGQA